MTMPDPWPSMLVEYEEPGMGWRRQAIDSVRIGPGLRFRRDDGSFTEHDRMFFCLGGVSVPWTPEFVREVRSATGEVLWRADASAPSDG